MKKLTMNKKEKSLQNPHSSHACCSKFLKKLENIV